MTTRRRTLIAALAVASLGMAACGGDEDNSGGGEDGANTLEQLKEEGTITIGYAGEEPYSFQNDDGELTGATVAIDKKVFNELGIENVEGKQVAWEALIPGLAKGEFDAISAGMSILPERCDKAAFADPTIMYTTALMVPEGNPEGLSTLQDVADAGLTLAVTNGAIEQGYAEDMGIDTQVVSDMPDGMDAVANQRADVFALTGISLRAMAENNPDAGVEVTESFTAVVDGVEQVGAGSTVFRKDDTELLKAYNEELASIVGEEQAFVDTVGEFGFTDAERPQGDITTEQLCNGELPGAEGSGEEGSESGDSGSEESPESEDSGSDES